MLVGALRGAVAVDGSKHGDGPGLLIVCVGLSGGTAVAPPEVSVDDEAPPAITAEGA